MKSKYLCVKKGYFRIGNPAYTNVIYRNKSIEINLSEEWLVNLFGWNTKVIEL